MAQSCSLCIYIEAEVDSRVLRIGATMPTSLNDTFDGLVPMESLTRVSTQHLHRVSPHIRQTFHRTRPSQKPPLILEMVKEQLKAGQTLMIFCHDSKTCDWLSQFLQEHGVDAPRFNGAMMQRYRRGLFEQFQRGDFRCLVCTDIASRGLDTTNVTHVINYDFPNVGVFRSVDGLIECSFGQVTDHLIY